MKTESSPDAFDATMRVAAASDKRFADGRYVARRILGAGGQKIVYLVHDETLGRDCALALLKTELLEPEDLERLRREAQAMARVEQANIVAVYDAGEDAGRPFFVCQYVSGGDLRQELRAAGGPLAIGRALAIAADVCAGLAAAHALGIVHRDIKPGNIWLSQDGSAKLGDFGLAFSIDRTRVTMSGTVMGTASYLAPEQALGQPVDARCDLYAVGCVLYEMLTGRPPFLGEDAVSVITQHIETPPVAPSWHNPQVPPALESLTLRLLAKSPDERPASAEEVREALIAVSESSPVTALPSAPERATSLDRLAGGVFVGREHEVAELRAELDETLSGRGTLTLLFGEPGIGKTRTANELCTYARLRGAQVLVGRCHEGEGAPAYWPWIEAIRSYIHDSASDELRTEMGAGASDIAQIVSEVHERLPGLRAPARLDPDEARFRLFDSVTAFFKNAAKRRPLVLVLDDLHWADKASLLMLQFLARDIKTARVLLLGTYRDVELGRQHPLAQTLAELAREQIGTRVLLRGLGEPDVARYIEMTSRVTPTEALVAVIFRETEGNPFFLSEVVRLLVAEGRLEDARDTQSWTLAIPQGVREVIGRRLDHLSEDCNRVLMLASVIGREFGLDALERLTDFNSDRLLELLEEAEAARVVTEVGGVGGAIGRYSFSHALISGTLYDELSITRRARLHKQVGEVLEALYGRNIEPHLPELAQHFYLGAGAGDVAKAVEYLRRAGERASHAWAEEEAGGYFQRALELIYASGAEDKRLRCELEVCLAEVESVYNPAPAIERALTTATLAKELFEPEFLARCALAHRSAVNRESFVQVEQPGATQANFETSRQLLHDALDALPRNDSRVRAMVSAALGERIYAYSVSDGIADESEAWHRLVEQAVEMAERIRDPETLAATLSARFYTREGPAHLDDRLAITERLLALNEETGWADAWIHVLRGRVLMQYGDIAGADAQLQKAEERARNLSGPDRMWITLWKAMRAYFGGSLSDAERLAFEAIASAQTSGGANRTHIQAVVPLYFVRREQGRLEEIEPFVRALVGRAQAPRTETVYSGALAFLYAELGREAEARAELEPARSAARQLGRARRLDEYFLAICSLYAETSAVLHDAALAEQTYRLLAPYEALNATLTVALCAGSVARSLGLLATTLEQWEAAERHFHVALEANERMGTPLWIAYTKYNYATMLIKRGGDGDADRARDLLAGALNITQQLGMSALQAKIEAIQG